MNRERANELLPIMKAYAEGKTIQCYNFNNKKWYDLDYPTFDNMSKYRIKPHQNYRPYTFDEMKGAIKKHGCYIECDKEVYIITSFNKENVNYGGFCNHIESYKNFTRNTWLDDNSPCGVMEED